MKAGLVGPSYVERSLPFDAQRTINLYPVIDETKRGKEITALYGTPGLKNFAVVGNGPIRASFSSTNDRAFVVSGNTLYELFEDGTSVSRGVLNSNLSNITIDENSTQLGICDGKDIYIFTYATDIFAQASLPFSPALTVTEHDGYFIANTSNGQFYVSALNDGLSWAALDFATAESSPDGLVRVISAMGQLCLIGARTTEFWVNTGDLDFPFERVQGARIDAGTNSPNSVLYIDDTLVWLGQNEQGKGIVYRVSGYSPKRISTFPVERIFSKLDDISGLLAYAYQEDGHLFYIITGGDLETSWAFDFATGQWHERAYLENSGVYSTHKAATCMFAFGKQLVGDKNGGIIYEMSLNFLDDDGREIRAQRTFTHINFEGKQFSVSRLQVDFENAVGNVNAPDPKSWLEISEDGGRSWGNASLSSIGKIGQTKKINSWRRLGITENQMTFRVTISDPVRRAICGAYFE